MRPSPVEEGLVLHLTNEAKLAGGSLVLGPGNVHELHTALILATCPVSHASQKKTSTDL